MLMRNPTKADDSHFYIKNATTKYYGSCFSVRAVVPTERQHLLMECSACPYFI
jgi:hypothetical protein